MKQNRETLASLTAAAGAEMAKTNTSRASSRRCGRAAPRSSAGDAEADTVLVDPDTGYPVLTDDVALCPRLSARLANDADEAREHRDIRWLAAGVASLLGAGLCSAIVIAANTIRHA